MNKYINEINKLREICHIYLYSLIFYFLWVQTNFKKAMIRNDGGFNLAKERYL
jgi:hypothetical protein